MKKQFIIPVNVMAYTKEEAQANVDLLLQKGAFLKDFNLNNLAGSFLTRFVVAKISEMTHATKSKVGCKPEHSQCPTANRPLIKTKMKMLSTTNTKLS